MVEQFSYQQELFVEAIDSGQVEARSLLDPTSAGLGAPVPLVERDIRLQNVIAYLIEASELDRVTGLSVIRRNSRQKAGHLRYLAQSEFLYAAGCVLPEGIVSATEIKQAESLGLAEFQEFRRAYFLTNHPRDPQEYRRKLIANVSLLQGIKQTLANRENGFRPYRPEVVETTTPRVLNTLSNHEKLVALRKDPRAGFMPTTNLEKGMLLAYLDYLDNPVHPLSVNNQFLEVFNFTQKLRRQPKNKDLDPSRGPLSITYELGDFLADAVRSRKALEDLELLLADCVNQRVTLGDEADVISPDHPGCRALIRYLDLEAFFDTEEGKVLANPMLTRTKRTTRVGPGRHKTVGSIYSSEFVSEEDKAIIDEAISTLNVGKAHAAIRPAVADQILRESYLRQILSIIASPSSDTPSAALEVLQPATEVAQAILVRAGSFVN